MAALPSWNESRMLATLRHYPRTVKLLLSATLMLTLAKAITFPYWLSTSPGTLPWTSPRSAW